GIAVVGALSPPTRTRAKKVSRRGPVFSPSVPPPPEKEPTSDHPDGVDGTLRLGCADTTCRTASCPAAVPAGRAGVTVSVCCASAPDATYEIVTNASPPSPGRP